MSAVRRLARAAAEAPPSIRWRLGQLRSRTLYRAAFAELGPGSTIVAPLKLRGTDRIRIGSGCAIYERVWLEAEGTGAIVIGDGVYLGHDVHLHAVTGVTIGDGTMLTDGVLVSDGGHDPTDGMAVTASRGPIAIGARVFVGQRAMVLGGVTVGDGAVIGAGSIVTRDVPPGATVAGIPAKPIGDGA